MPLPKRESYTTDYIYALPEGERAELIEYTFSDSVKAGIYEDFTVNFGQLGI